MLAYLRGHRCKLAGATALTSEKTRLLPHAAMRGNKKSESKNAFKKKVRQRRKKVSLKEDLIVKNLFVHQSARNDLFMYVIV